MSCPQKKIHREQKLRNNTKVRFFFFTLLTYTCSKGCTREHKNRICRASLCSVTRGTIAVSSIGFHGARDDLVVVLGCSAAVTAAQVEVDVTEIVG